MSLVLLTVAVINGRRVDTLERSVDVLAAAAQQQVLVSKQFTHLFLSPTLSGVGGVIPAIETLERLRSSLPSKDQLDVSYAIAQLKAHVYESRLIALSMCDAQPRERMASDFSVLEWDEDYWILGKESYSRIRLRLRPNSDARKGPMHFSVPLAASLYPGMCGETRGSIRIGSGIAASLQDCLRPAGFDGQSDIGLCIVDTVITQDQLNSDNEVTLTLAFGSEQPLPYSFAAVFLSAWQAPSDRFRSAVHLRELPQFVWGGEYSRQREVVQLSEIRGPRPWTPYEREIRADEWIDSRGVVDPSVKMQVVFEIVKPGPLKDLPVLSFVQGVGATRGT